VLATRSDAASIWSRLGILAAALVAAVAVLALGSASATAAVGVQSTFGSPGSDQSGGFGGAGSAAVNNGTGHVYISDQGKNRVAKYTADGEFVRVWGSDVIRSGPDNGPNEVQRLTVEATGGTYKVNAGFPKSDPIPYNAPASEVEDIINDLYLPHRGGTVTVTGSFPVYTVTFDSPAFAGNDAEMIEVITSGLTGDNQNVTVETITPGGGFEKCEAGSSNVCKAGTWGEGQAGTFAGPGGIAVDQATGDVYVTDAAQRVQKFDSDGDFLLAFGNDVVRDGAPGDTGTGFEVCTVAADCRAGGEWTGLGGEFSWSFYNADLTVSPAGDVYVADPGAQRVQKFSSSGDFLLAFGHDVIQEGAPGDTGSGFEVCTVAADCKEGAGGSEDGQFAFNAPSRIDTDSTGRIYVVDSENGRVQRFTSAPAFDTVFAPAHLSAPAPADIFIDRTNDHLFAARSNPNDGQMNILELDASGALLNTYLEGGEVWGIGGLAVNPATDLIYATSGSQVLVLGEVGLPEATIDPVSSKTAETATLTGSVDPNGGPAGNHFEISTDGVNWEPLAEGDRPVGNGDSPVAVSQEIGGLAPGTTYYVRLVAKQTYGGEKDVSAEVSFTTDDAAPEVTGAPAIARATEAIIAGNVNPGNEATEYHFEYGTAPCGANPCTKLGTESAGSGADQVYVKQAITGLTPNTTYHYRLIAGNGTGTTIGPERTFITLPPGTLPEGRRYEQVSPVFKNNADINSRMAMASEDGEKLAFTSLGSFAGQPSSLSAMFTHYLSTRGPEGWTTKGLLPPGGALNFQAGYYGFSQDLTAGAYMHREDAPKTLAPGAKTGINMYRRDLTSNDWQLMSGTLATATSFAGFVWASKDFSHVVFDSPNPLTPDSPCILNGPPWDNCVYEWVNGELRLASVDPNGNPVFGFGGHGSPTGQPNGSLDYAVSDDGERIFFSGHEHRGVFARTGGTTTIEVTVPERSTPPTVSGEETHFLGASASGDKVIFATVNTLVDEDDNQVRDIYMYDFAQPQGERLTLLSEDSQPAAPNGADVPTGAPFGGQGGIVARTRSLDRIYFMANNQIVPGEPNLPGPKLFLWDDTGAEPEVRYITNLSENDANAWRGATVSIQHMKPARPSPDGRYLAFVSETRQTGYDNEGGNEIYLYDVQTDRIECATCSPNAKPKSGMLGFDSFTEEGAIPPLNHLLRNVTPDGKLFFETSRGLVWKDSNGMKDVYEYVAGQIHLISTGTSGDHSRFLDASASGNDVFFTTRSQLVGWDNDENQDAYNATVDGGFPEPPPAPPACEGDACQPPPVVPDDPTPASSGFVGPGNPPVKGVRKPKRCKSQKGKAKRAKHCKKKKSKQQGKQKKTTKRNG
jgi:hypothetical protein